MVKGAQMWRAVSGVDRTAGRSERERVVPVATGLQHVLIDTPELCVYLNALRVYPSGLRFRVVRLLRPGAGETACRAFAQGLRVGPPAWTEAAEILSGPLLGVRYSEEGRPAEEERGAVVDLFGRYQVTLPEGGESPVLEIGGGHSSDTEAENEFHLYGLPKQGAITLLWRWQALGVAESSLELDGDVLRAAAARAIVLWDEREPGESAGAAPSSP